MNERHEAEPQEGAPPPTETRDEEEERHREVCTDEKADDEDTAPNEAHGIGHKPPIGKKSHAMNPKRRRSPPALLPRAPPLRNFPLTVAEPRRATVRHVPE